MSQNQNALPSLPRSRQKRSDSQNGDRILMQDQIENGEHQMRSNLTQRSISYQHGGRPIYNQSNYDPTLFREYKREQLDREEAEKNAMLLRNRIVLLQKQKLDQDKKLKSTQDQATKLFNMKKQIQQEKEQRELRKLQKMEEKEIQALKVKERKQAMKLNKADQKVKDKQLKQLEVFRIKQQALIDKKRREQQNLVQQVMNQQKRDERLYYEKSISQNKKEFDNYQHNNDAKITEKIQEEKYRNREIQQYLQELETMEMSLVEGLKQTKSNKQHIQDKIKYAYSLDYNGVKQAFPDINRKMNTRYEDIYTLTDYQSPYNREHLRKTLPKMYDTRPKFDIETGERAEDIAIIERQTSRQNKSGNNQKPVSLYTEDYKQKQLEKQKQSQRELEQIPVEAEF